MSYFLFLSLGIILLLVSVICNLQDWGFGYELFLNLGITVTAVTVVEYIWRQAGGEPISKAVDRLRVATMLLKDLDETGIMRVYIERHDSDSKVWHQRIVAANEVDIMGLCLSRNLLERPEIKEMIECSQREKNQVPISYP
jgi:hypothetical protein